MLHIIVFDGILFPTVGRSTVKDVGVRKMRLEAMHKPYQSQAKPMIIYGERLPRILCIASTSAPVNKSNVDFVIGLGLIALALFWRLTEE